MFEKVSFETICRATFNYWEPSLLINKDDRIFRVFQTKYPISPEPNLVVIEAFRDPREAYFGSFVGKNGGECETEKETQKFYRKLRNIISPEHRVNNAKNLERKINELIDKIDVGIYKITK